MEFVIKTDMLVGFNSIQQFYKDGHVFPENIKILVSMDRRELEICSRESISFINPNEDINSPRQIRSKRLWQSARLKRLKRKIHLINRRIHNVTDEKEKNLLQAVGLKFTNLVQKHDRAICAAT